MGEGEAGKHCLRLFLRFKVHAQAQYIGHLNTRAYDIVILGGKIKGFYMSLRKHIEQVI